jgi:acyl-CoA synthetase (NDP forming)
MASAVSPQARWLRDRGIPVLEGTATGLRALRHLLDDAERRALPPLASPAPVADEVRDAWRERLVGRPLREVEALHLLADYGVVTVPAEEAATLDGTLAAAERVGYPVALKTANPEIAHKTDAGGVRLALRDPDQLRVAYDDVTARLGPLVTVAAMAPAGVEVALGLVRDPMFGPLLLVAAGGVLVEVLHDRRLGLPPLDEPRAARLVERLQIRPLLGGVRGAPAADVPALVHAVARLSVLAADLGEHLDALDVNPVMVSPTGCVAVDALVVPRSA